MRKRFIAMKAVLAAVCVAAISITAGSSALPQSAAADEYEENGLKLWVYDCETGEESTRIFHTSGTVPMETELISASSFGNDDGGISTNAIIGSEDRVQITNTEAAPYQYTCYMYSVYKDGTKSYPYSGFMIGAKAAVTAAHCVFDGKSTLDYVVVVPGKNGGAESYKSTEPYGSAKSIKVAISDEYINNRNRADDWAIIELNWNIGYQSKWPALKYKSGSYNGTSVENTGYPGKSEWFTLQNKEGSLMFSGKGTIRYSYEYNDRFIYGRGTLRGDWDATGGNSGGPVFAYYSDTGYTVIGILTGGSYDDGDSYNSNSCYTEVTRISSDMYEIFMSYC